MITFPFDSNMVASLVGLLILAILAGFALLANTFLRKKNAASKSSHELESFEWMGGEAYVHADILDAALSRGIFASQTPKSTTDVMDTTPAAP